MEALLLVNSGYCCKKVKFESGHTVPWLTSIESITLNDHIAILGPLDDPMEAIGRAFTRHLWNTGLLDEYPPKTRTPTVLTCILNLQFVSHLKNYNIRLVFYYGEREPGKKLSVVVSEEQLAKLLFARVVEGDMLFLMVEARARYVLVLTQVSCVMNGLDLVLA